MKHNYILFLDMETGGLNPGWCNIWEIACITTNLDFEEVDRFHCYIKHDTCGGLDPVDRYLDELKVKEPYVWNMHTETGLMEKWVAAQENGAVYRTDADAMLCEYVANRDDLMVLGGSSVHYDHNFAAEHLVRFNQRLQHRHMDISSIKTFLNTFGKPNYSDKFRDDKGTKHLAMDDIENDIRWAKNFKQFLKPLLFGE